MPLVVEPELILKNTIENVDLTVLDSSGNNIDVTGSGEIELTILKPDGNELFVDKFNSPPDPPTRIIKITAATGKYYFPFGDEAGETDSQGEYLFKWRVTQDTGLETESRIQVVTVVTASVYKLIDCFRLQIDKSRKLVDLDPMDPLTLGYTDEDLLKFLNGGLTLINAAQPYPTFSSLDSFPGLFSQILIDAGLLVGIMTQQLYAIDTDIPNYSDQGNAFVLDHFPRLAAYCGQLRDDLKTRIPDMKRHLITTGSVKIEAAANFRLAQLIQAAPNGALFRNFFHGIL